MDTKPPPNVSGEMHRLKWLPLRKLLARIAIAFRHAEMPRLAPAALVEEARLLETLNRVGNTVAAELDIDRVVQVVTDAANELTGATFCAFFYSKTDEKREHYWLYALSGAERKAFTDFPIPRNVALFDPTFKGEGVVRSNDITKDPRYGKNLPNYATPLGHLAVRSYLAAPVVSRAGEVLGALFCGHPDVGVFGERAERLLTGVAAQAATALDNARLYDAAQRDIAERKKAEEQLRRRELELAAIKDDLALQVAALTRMHELAMHLTGTLDLRAALQAVLETVVEIHGADFGLLSLYDPASDVLRTHASVGFDAKTIKALDHIKPGEGPCGLAFAQKTRVVIDDTQNDPRSGYRDIARAVGFHTVHSTPITTGTGDVLGVISVQFVRSHRPTQREMQFADMCAHHAAEEIEAVQALQARRESEARFRHMADNAPVLIWVNDKGGCEFVNSEYLRFAGKVFEDLRGTGWTSLVHTDDVERYVHDYQWAAERHQPFEAQCRMRHTDGGYRWLRSTAMPRFGPDGEFLGYVGCSVDITDIKKSEDALKEADRRKDEFLATLAHELRNPLAPLCNGLQIMRLAEQNPSAIEQARNMMERQLKHMVRLVDDLLEVSRISSGKITLRKERTDVAVVLHSAIETSRPFIEEAKHEFIVNLPSEPLWLNADVTRLAQVFANLLNNAAKYTEANGRIRLKAERHGPQVVVRVKDNGIGIAADTLPQVFEMFAQADQSIEKSRGGLGVGLTLAKHLVTMHDGVIEAHSDGPGKGSEFVVRLPLAASEVTTAHDGGDVPDATGSGAVPLRILVADDNMDAATSMEVLLEILGNRVCIANDGAAAVAAAEEFRPDVVMLDIGMPKMNGYDAAEAIRRQPWGRDMVLVAVTGWGQDSDKQRSKTVGFDYHIVKPITSTALNGLMIAIQQKTRDRSGRMPAETLN